MATHKFNINTPYLKASIEATLPIDRTVSPFRALIQLYKSYFKFATHQTLTFFKHPAQSTTK
ncbi:hypothetical protein [Secundilactobacillus muriivasis]